MAQLHAVARSSRLPIVVGMNGRFFPNNWRPALDEITFADGAGFAALQFPGKTEGLGERHLGAPLEAVGEALAAAELAATMEILIRVGREGKTAEGLTPYEVFEANQPAIAALRCTHVHWHLVPIDAPQEDEMSKLERQLVPQFRRAVSLAQQGGYAFGFEHNEPDLLLFSTLEGCACLLGEVGGLGLVWDFNHTIPAHLADFKALGERVMGLHVSDTPLPEVNHHLPLGLGNLDVEGYCAALLKHGFRGPAILEIGGLPKSGGYGRDTDEALIDSASRPREAVRRAMSA